MTNATSIALDICNGKYSDAESPNHCEFSEQDYSAPGYLVACGKVFTQSGRGTAKEL